MTGLKAGLGVGTCFSPVIDTDTFHASPGLLEVLYVSQPDTPVSIVNTYLRFDLSSIPLGSQITAAHLRLYLQDGEGTSPLTMRVWRVTSDWTEAGLTIDNQPGHAFPPYTASINTTPGWKSWDVESIVQGWVSGAAPNYGLLVDGNEAGTYYDRRFRSREYGEGERGVGDFDPCLIIAYAAPQQTTTPPPTWTAVPTWTPVPQPTTAFTLPAIWDYQVLGIQLHQTISFYCCFGQEVPLIADKATLVRVYATSTDTQARSVTVSLRAFRGQTELPSCPSVTPITRTLPPLFGFPPNFLSNPSVQEDLSLTFNFVLPPTCSWVDHDSTPVVFRATVTGDYGGDASDFIPANDVFDSNGFFFFKMRPLRVKPYIFTYGGPGPANGSVPTNAQIAAGMAWVTNLYPIDSVDLKSPGFFTTTRNFNSPNSSQQFLDTLGDFLDGFEDCCGVDSVDSNLAILPSALFPGSGWQGISWTDSRYAVSNAANPQTFAHEMGHNLGLQHAGNDHGEDAGGGWEQFPIDHGGTGGRGWDPTRPTKFSVSTGSTSGNSWHSHDTMSYGSCTDNGPADNFSAAATTYCDSEWISPYNYARLTQRMQCADPQTFDDFDNLSCLGNGPFDQVLTAYSLRQPEPRQYLRVDGRVLIDGTVELKPFYRLSLPSGTADRPGRGPYSIELHGEDGTVLAERQFTPREASSHHARQPSLIQELMPWVTGTTQIVVVREGRILADRVVSENQPTVTLLSPNGGESLAASGEMAFTWSAADTDSDRLYAWLEYSADAGSTWESLGRNIEGTSLVVDLANLAGSNHALVRVRVTDGVNTAVAVSERPFVVARKAPFVGIVTPVEGAQLAAGATVTLSGLATDHEDGMLSEQTYAWSSSVDGQLGVGDRLQVSLSPGDHVITLSATDSDGQLGESSVMVHVNGPVSFGPRGLRLASSTPVA